MARGLSIHLGLNSVDASQYGGWSGDLNACESDAKDMEAIARAAGFSGTKLLTKEATSEAVLERLHSAAKDLVAGDTLLLTYSGHGGQVPDMHGDEDDRADETWVLYDRQLIDDELYDAYSRFAEGVRIAVFSDSCHSGTVTRVGPPVPAGQGVPVVGPSPVRTGHVQHRAMPPARAQVDYLRRAELYRSIQGKMDTADDRIGACVVLISGCQDNQLSLDGTFNGLFTATLLTVWNGGRFRGGYRELRDRITRRMPETQTPNFSVVGRFDTAFVNNQPFMI